MEVHQLHHLTQAYAALTQSQQVIVGGYASLLRTVREPSSVLGERIEALDCAQILVYDNTDTAACVSLVNTLVGANSPFYHMYGYYIDAKISWKADLPTGWDKRCEYISHRLGGGPIVLSTSPADTVLNRLHLYDDTLLVMDLMMGGVTPAPKLLALLDRWTSLKDSRRLALRSTIIDIATSLDLALSEEARPHAASQPDARATSASPDRSVVLPLIRDPSRRKGYSVAAD